MSSIGYMTGNIFHENNNGWPRDEKYFSMETPMDGINKIEWTSNYNSLPRQVASCYELDMRAYFKAALGRYGKTCFCRVDVMAGCFGRSETFSRRVKAGLEWAQGWSRRTRYEQALSVDLWLPLQKLRLAQLSRLVTGSLGGMLWVDLRAPDKACYIPRQRWV